MSKSRILLRIILVLMVIGLLVLGVYIWRRGTPDYYWSKAQTAMEAEKYEDARIQLANLVRSHPTHADGLEMLSRVILLEGQSKGRPATFPANPAAADFLARAAELRPGDADLQQRALRAYLSLRQFGKAADFAENVYKSNPQNGDAHFALLWRAVETKNAAKVAKLSEDFKKIQSRHVFQNLALLAKYHWDKDDKQKSDELLAQAASTAAQLTPEQLGLLERRDREAMLALLLGYQDRADKPEVALRRARFVLDGCNKLNDGNLIDKRIVANAAAQSIALFNMKYPPIQLAKGLTAIQAELAKEAEVLGTAALADKRGGPAPMLVYWNTARSHMAAGEFDKALAVLDEGFKAAEQLGKAIGEQDLDLHLLAARILIMKRDFAAANEHLDKLIGNKRFEGWGHLLKGSVALHEGRLHPAETHFAAARKALGDTVLVKMSLAHTAMALEQWDKAVPMLDELLEGEEGLSDEQRAWFTQLLGSGTRVHFDLLRAKLAQKRWADAQVHLKLLKGSEFEPSAWALAITYKWDEEKEEEYARRLLDLSRQKFPDDLNLAMLDARLLHAKGQNSHATRLLEAFAAAKPEDESRHLALARWLIRNREANKALEKLEILQRQEDLSPQARNTIAVYRVQALIGSSQFELAKAEADALTKREETKTAGYLMKAALAFREKDETAGVALLEQAQKSNPRNAPLAMMVSKIRSAQGDFEGVLEAGVDVMDVDRFSNEARATVGDALQKLAKEQGPEKALAKVEELLKTRPDDFALRVLKVDLLVRLKQFEKAMEEMRLAELQSPDDPNIPRLKAQVLLANDRGEEALQEVERALKADEKNPEVLLLAAQVAMVAKDFKKGVEYAGKARRAAPASAQAYALLADALRRDNRIEDAIAVLKGYAQRDPNDYGIRLALIDLLRTSAGHEADALLEIRTVRLAHPEDFRLTLAEIDLLLAMDRSADAQSAATDLLGDKATVAQTLAVGQIFAEKGEVVSAQQWGQRALAAAQSKEQIDANLFLGKLYLQEGRADAELERDVDLAILEKAKTHFAAALKQEPRHLIAGNNLAWLLAEHFGQAKEAVRIVEQVRADTDVSKLPAAFIDTMAMCYVHAGDVEKAKKILRTGLTTYPNDGQLMYRLAMHSEGQQAKEMLQRAIEIGGLEKVDEELARQKLKSL